MPIQKLLVANRGEIARRIFRTCRRLGIRTVAIFSDADRGALHVREADEAVRIGPSPASESYLRHDRVIEAALRSGADAIHPGYGFLSENAAFAEAVISSGLTWVGPPVSAIRSMGPKDEAKRIAEAAGVPVLPGYRGEAQDLPQLIQAAGEIGYPLLIKAVAGGGGRGIRQVGDAAGFAMELASAAREAEAAFGDGRILLEKLVECPRHIEVQIFADSHGNIVHLHERDCSLQRRRQKVVEEAPAPGLPASLRQAMAEDAVRLARAVGYVGAGTVEFILDGARPPGLGSYWFLEMNTRLQVEHPVTEMVTGTDLVEWQLVIASGGRLPLSQDDIGLTGHAVEVRICAEDPSRDFLPGAGLIAAWRLPETDDELAIRTDAGFSAGDRVPPDYDSLLAKLIVHASSREAAIGRMASLLDHAQIAGVSTNTGFLRRCLLSPAFREARHDVNRIAQDIGSLTTIPEEHREAALQAVARIMLQPPATSPAGSPWSLNDGFRLNAPARRMVRLSVDGVSCELHEPLPEADPAKVLVTQLSPRRFAATCGGDTFMIAVPEYEEEAEAALGGDCLRAPMPGRLLALDAVPGREVSRGETLGVMEAMKMEHALRAPRDGVIGEVHAGAGQQLAEGDLLVTLLPEPAPAEA